MGSTQIKQTIISPLYKSSQDIMTQTKKQKKTSPQKKKVAKRVLRSAARGAFQLLDPKHQETIRGLTDPFSSEATSARYPDAGSGKTLIQRAMLSFTGPTNASGAYAAVFDANVSFPIHYAATITGTTATWHTVKHGDWSTNLLNTYGDTARPTSCGIRIVNTLSATDSAGYLVIAKGGPPLVGIATTFDPTNFTSYEVHPFVHGGEWHVTLHPRGANAYNWVPTSSFSSNTAPSNPNWQTAYIALFGSKASATPLLMEVVSNFEYVPKEDAPVACLAENQPVLDINMQTAVNEVQSSHNGLHAGNHASRRNKLEAFAKKALVKHVLPFAVKKAKQALM